jgi:trehalose synthase
MEDPPGATQADTSTASPRRVSLKRSALERYRELVGDELVAEVRELAEALRGRRVLELSATATGGGVAELLASLVPLKRDLGIEAEWRVIAGDLRFFEVTKRIHNGLQGMEVELSDAQRDEYLRHNQENARSLEGGWDAIVVHDPQPAAVRSFAPDLAERWAWRCHIDSSAPHRPTWEFLRPYVELHDRAAFTLRSFVPPDLEAPTSLLLPAIDPITSKNQRLPDYLARQTVAALGVDLARPLLLQVSRFDPWKDPLGVVEVWRRVRETFPNQMGVANHEVNAFQLVADVAIQKSIREGFGLVVSETLWKGTAMVAGRAGGIPEQLREGVGGYLAESVDEFAARTTELLEDPVRAEEIGAAGAEAVGARFLLPRLLRDDLALLSELVA